MDCCSEPQAAGYSVRGLRRARVVLQCASPDAGHRELDGRYHSVLREHVYFSAEERGSGFDRLRTVEASLETSSSLVEDGRRSSVGLVVRGFVTDVSDGDSPLLPKVLGRLQSVEASQQLENVTGKLRCEELHSLPGWPVSRSSPIP